MSISVEKLFQSYGAYLRAKMQQKEFTGWGGDLADGFRKAIEEHRLVEEAYIAEQIALRRSSDAALKEDLDKIETKWPRRLR